MVTIWVLSSEFSSRAPAVLYGGTMLSAYHIRIAAWGAVFFDVQRATNRIYLFIEWGRGEAQSIRWHWPPLKGGVAKLKPVLPEPPVSGSWVSSKDYIYHDIFRGGSLPW